MGAHDDQTGLGVHNMVNNTRSNPPNEPVYRRDSMC